MLTTCHVAPVEQVEDQPDAKGADRLLVGRGLDVIALTLVALKSLESAEAEEERPCSQDEWKKIS